MPLYNDLRQRPDRSQSHRNTREKTDDCFHIRLLNMAERARGHCYPLHQPRVRPFGTAHVFEGKLYIQTGKVKDVSKQIHANPKVEICAFKNGEWLRVAGELVEDDRREARQSMLDAYSSLQNMYSADDGNTEVFYFKNATATFSSFTHEPEVVKF